MDTFLIEARRCAILLIDEAQNALGGFDQGSSGSRTTLAASDPKLSVFVQLLLRLSRAQTRNMWSDYKTYIKYEKPKSGSGYNSYARQDHTSEPQKGKRVINFWAFSPGIAMEELKSLGRTQENP